jgi:chemotaxis protein histidine kinase CheA
MAPAHRLILVALIALASLGSTLAQAEVDAATLEQAFSERLPRGWSITELTIEAQENYGTSIEPDIRSRFQASVALNEDTFIVVSQTEDATLLQRMANAGETRTFYGVSTSRRQGAGWQTTLALENDPTAGLGRPSGFFAGRIIILGTDTETQYRAELQAQEQATHEASLTRSARDEEARAQAREAELAEAAHAIALEEAERQARREAEAAAHEESLTRSALDEEARAQARETELAEAAHAIALEEAERQARREATVAAQEHEATLAAAQRAREATELEIWQQALAALAEGMRSELQTGLTNRIPPFWIVETLTLGAYEVAGTTEAPTITQTVQATVELTHDLHASVTQEGGITLLDAVEEAGTRRELYANVIGRWNGTFWLTDWTFESLDGLRSGLPRDQFPAQAIVIGSAAETTWRASLEAERVRRATRLTALASTLESGSVADKEAAIARALGSGDDVEANVAMRYILRRTSLLAVRLSLFEADANDEDALSYLREAASLGVAIDEFDPESGAFSGVLRTNLTMGNIISANEANRHYRGQLAGTSVSITTAKGHATLTLDLAAPGRLEGTFDYGYEYGRSSYPTLRAAAEIQ